jgi:tRNA threonylcarbamoyladenosine biosynthesis protein TsaB
MAVAKGLALARRLPLVAVPTLDIVASAQWPDDRPLRAVLEAGRGRICVSPYLWQKEGWVAQADPRLTTWSKLLASLDAPTLFCGEIDSSGIAAMATAGALAVLLPAAIRLRRAGFLAELAWRRVNLQEYDDPATLAPIYLRQPT